MASIRSAVFDVPVCVDATWCIDRRITIRRSGRYFLFLAFDRRDAPYEQLRALVGGAYGQKIEVDGVLVDAREPPGLPVPVEWSFRTNDNVVVARGDSQVLGGNSFSGDETARLLYSGYFAARDYCFGAELHHGITAFRGIRAHLRLEPEPK
jgi:hypothetical protein